MSIWDKEALVNAGLKKLETRAYLYDQYEERDGCFPAYYKTADIYEPYTGPGRVWPEPKNIKPLVTMEDVEAAIALVRQATIDECIKFVEGGVFLTNDAPAARMAKECAREMRKQIS
jgi:hypothetical protein